jgi:outer membrane protein TolC
MRRFVAIGIAVVVAIGITRLGVIEGQEKKDPPGKDSLEKLQADGLKNNNDIKVAEAKMRIAEAKLRLAEAEVERARARAKGEIATAFADFQAALAAEKEANIRRIRVEKLRMSGAVSAEDLGAALLTFAKIKLERNQAELRLRILVGRPIGEIADPKVDNK